MLKRLWRFLLRGTLVAVVAGSIGAVALVTYTWWERTRDLVLPAPSGPLPVGRTIVDWVDPHRTDPLAPTQDTRPELLAWIWYPSSRAGTADFLPADMRTGWTQSGTLGWLTHDLSRVHTHSADDADIRPASGSYPVAILRGGASAGVVNYTTMAEDLASHGYVVVGLDAPYRTNVVVFPDGRVVHRRPENNPELCDGPTKRQCFERLLAAWVSDIGFAIDRLSALNAADPSGRFTGRIDLTRIGVFGHSFGGSQAAQFCHDDPRCKAGIDIDGIPLGTVIHEGMRQPFLFVFSAQIHATDPESRAVQADIQSLYDHLPVHARARVAVRGSFHFTFSDDGALLKSGVIQGLLRTIGLLRIAGPRQLAVTAYCVRTFFDTYVRDASTAVPVLTSPEYPEVESLD
jgi:dienelactone hydrolase